MHLCRFSYFDSKIENNKIKGKFSSKKKSPVWLLATYGTIPLFRKKKTKKPSSTLKKKFTKRFSTLFSPPIKNRTKIKCSTHKSVKKIAKFFLSCNKIALGLSSLNQIIQYPSFWVHRLLYVPLSLNCKELYW